MQTRSPKRKSGPLNTRQIEASDPELSTVKKAKLGRVGYGFAPPARAVIAGTNNASTHAIPNPMSTVFDMTRSHNHDMQR